MSQFSQSLRDKLSSMGESCREIMNDMDRIDELFSALNRNPTADEVFIGRTYIFCERLLKKIQSRHDQKDMFTELENKLIGLMQWIDDEFEDENTSEADEEFDSINSNVWIKKIEEILARNDINGYFFQLYIDLAVITELGEGFETYSGVGVFNKNLKLRESAEYNLLRGSSAESIHTFLALLERYQILNNDNLEKLNESYEMRRKAGEAVDLSIMTSEIQVRLDFATSDAVRELIANRPGFVSNLELRDSNRALMSQVEVNERRIVGAVEKMNAASSQLTQLTSLVNQHIKVLKEEAKRLSQFVNSPSPLLTAKGSSESDLAAQASRYCADNNELKDALKQNMEALAEQARCLQAVLNPLPVLNPTSKSTSTWKKEAYSSAFWPHLPPPVTVEHASAAGCGASDVYEEEGCAEPLDWDKAPDEAVVQAVPQPNSGLKRCTTRLNLS